MLGCAENYTCWITEQGGEKVLWEVPSASRVKWRRSRDEVSAGQVDMLPSMCCDWIGSVETVKHELHIYRDGVPVWEGPIVRLEYQKDLVQIFAADILWVPARRVLERGYSYAYPNVRKVGYAIQKLLIDECFAQNTSGSGALWDEDRWNMFGHIHWVRGPDDPRTSSVRVPYSATIWELVDNFARRGGIDCTVIGRDIYHFDTHLAWMQLPDLNVENIGGWPRVTEFGNETYTRVFTTNNLGTASVAVADKDYVSYYGLVDDLISQDTEATVNYPPSKEELAGMLEQSKRSLQGSIPPPVRVMLPENSTLMPSTPWDINDIVPGAWFTINVPEGLCRAMSDEQKIDHMDVTFEAPNYETVQLTSISPPSKKVLPDDTVQ